VARILAKGRSEPSATLSAHLPRLISLSGFVNMRDTWYSLFLFRCCYCDAVELCVIF
jgi:hypothetical protein